jgi:hypothetical protein
MSSSVSHRRTLFAFAGALLLHGFLFTSGLLAQDGVEGDRPGSDLYSSPLVLAAPAPAEFLIDTRQADCAIACYRNGRCMAWTYVRPESAGGPGLCWLKKSMPPLVANACCVSGTIGEPDTNRPGGDYRNFNSVGTGVRSLAVSARQCRATCWKEAKCQAWTWVKPDTVEGTMGNCWLKDSIPAAEPNTCCISGTFFRF